MKKVTADLLPSWNDGATKTAIMEFVAAVCDENGKDYVKPQNRVATFDNDGTLWIEYPIHVQVLFAIDRVKALVAKHPEWKTKPAFKALFEDDMKTIAARGSKGNAEIIVASHAGMTGDEFEREVNKWFETSKSEHLNRLYIECIYQPQLELLAYLRANDFKTFIISGSGIQFMRPMAQKAYGIPPWQIVGSSLVSEFQIKNGKADVVRLPKVDVIDDKECKPVNIYEHIGVRPIFAFGNSDADIAMMQYTMGGKGRRMGLFVHHTDAEREYVYDRKSNVGRLDKALDEAKANGWIIVDMKNDWNTIFPPK